MSSNISVYGTLKRGHSNHRLLETAEFVGEYYVPFYTFRASGIPFLDIEEKEGVEKKFMKVESYLVDEDTLVRLDRLEGHPAYYERKKVPIYSMDPETNALRIVGDTEVYHYDVPVEDDQSDSYYLNDNIYEWARR